MQLSRFLPVALALGLIAGCSKSDASGTPGTAGDAMKAVGDAAKGALDKATAAFDGLKDLDLSDVTKLDPAKLQEVGKSAMNGIAAQLGSITDLASAKNVVGELEPWMDKLGSLKTALSGKLPDMESVKTAISGLTSKFSGNADIMGALKPVIEKLQALIG